MPRIDVIVPLYNKAGTVERAIGSIREQTFTDWQLIVVDDGSTDESPDIVRGMNDPRIKLIRQENQGPGAARNRGIAAGESPYVAFLDADDQWHPWYLENALRAIEESDAALVGSMYYEWPKQDDMTHHWRKRGITCREYQVEGDDDPEFLESLILFFHVGNSFLRREIAEKYGGFYTENKCISGEDTIFFARIVPNENVRIISPPAVVHHREDSNLSNTYDYPLSPILTKPEVVLDYIPETKKSLVSISLARLALRAARFRARDGQKNNAKRLLHLHPQARRFRREYYRCQYEIMLSWCMPVWVRLKCAVGPRVRSYLNTLKRRLGLAPRLPEKNHYDNTSQYTKN